jgi:AcrR family transcriptional regulator
MSFREPKNEVLSRARTPEDKAKVRDAFIAAGRRLLAEGDPSRVSLRMIAAEAGYAPGAIYQYFADQRELFFHVRARDMHAATEQLRRVIARTRDPAKRVQKLFVGTADYWLAHMEDFLIIFPAPSAQDPKVAPGAVPFGKSPVVQESLDLYYETVDGFFRTLPRPPMPSRLATDMLIAAVHGAIVFPCMTRTMEWSDTRAMVNQLVTTVVRQWKSAGSGVKSQELLSRN